MSALPVTFPWTRYWHPRGAEPTLEGEFLVPPDRPATWYRPGQAAHVVTLAQLAEVPCLVLRGRPGSGKSHEIAHEVERLLRVGGDGHVIRSVDLKLRSEALIEKEVFARKEFIGWTEGKHALTLIFDSMDECWRRIRELGPIILSALEPCRRKDLPPLRLRLGCRGAEWREEFEAELRSVFAEKTVGEMVQVWELAPLTEADVRAAAVASGLDVDRFMAEVTERRVGAFAADPITLRMLLDIAQEGGALGRDRAEIYQKGCSLLCRDFHQPVNGKRTLETTAPERLACASYLAAVSVLSNSYFVHGDPEEVPADHTGVIAPVDFLGRKPQLPGADVEFSRESILETLQTGLFEHLASGQFSWRHQSYPEYLAASYLQRRDIPAKEIIQSLCDTTTGRSRLWPQLEETACWLAALVPEVFSGLVATNADVFLRCDPVRLTDAQRGQVVEGLLAQVRSHEIFTARREHAQWLRRLRHAGLDTRLAAILRDTNEQVFVRDLALDIARACELRELGTLLVSIMFDPSEPAKLRHGSAVTLLAWADDSIRAMIRARMGPDRLDDDDVRGCVLSILWPNALTEEELIPLLVEPRRGNYVGSYQHFLFTDLAEPLDRVNLVPLLKWVHGLDRKRGGRGRTAFDGACELILLAGFRSIAKAEVRTAFMAIVEEQTRRDGVLFKPDGRDLLSETNCRRVFWRELMAGELPVRDTIVSASLREAGLIHEDDFDWALDEAAANFARRDRWLELAFWLFQPERRPEQIARMLPWSEADSAIAHRVLLSTSTPLRQAGRPHWKKAEYYREVKDKAARANRIPFAERIDQLLSRYESERKPEPIWRLMVCLTSPVKDPDEPGGNNMSEIGWKHLSSQQRNRMLAFAPDYLGVTGVSTEEVYSDKRYRSYIAGLGFMLELVAAKSDWADTQEPEFWTRWIPVLFEYQDENYHFDDEVWQQLLERAFSRAKSAFLAALQRWLANRGSRHLPLKRFELLPVASDAELECVLLEAALKPSSEAARRFEFVGFLLRKVSPRTETTVAAWRPGPGRGMHDEASFADAVLLAFRSPVYGREIIDRILADAPWGKQVFPYLGVSGGVYSQWVEFIDAERLTRMWEWLEREYPGDPYEDDDDEGVHSVTFAHEIYIFRNHLLSYVEGRNTREAVEALGALVRRRPELPWLGQVLAQSRRGCRRASWDPPSVGSLIAYFANPGLPPLCNDADLMDALIDSLRRYQAALKGSRPLTELWNERAGPVLDWSPKDEENASDCLARHFERDLRGHGVRAIREAELRQRSGDTPGDEPDILVTAPCAGRPDVSLTVLVEVKCSWNAEVVSGFEMQLLNRYLRGHDCGLYVVFHFACSTWSERDQRRRQSLSAKTMQEVSMLVEKEQQRLALTSGKRLDAVVVDAAL